MALHDSMAILSVASDPTVVAAAKAAWDRACEEKAAHQWGGCPGGCSMYVAACETGMRLAEAERAAWEAFRQARHGEVSHD